MTSFLVASASRGLQYRLEDTIARHIAHRETEAVMTMRAHAAAAIGSHQSGDYVLRLREHACAMPPEAGPLRRILERPAVQAVIAGYDTHNSDAIKWQRRYLFWGKVGIWTAVASIVPALLLTVAPITLPPLANVAASVLVWLLLCVSWACFIYLMRSQPQEKWYTARGNAEALRKRLFERVLAIDDETPGPNEIELLPLQIEYFRRYQLDVQRAYYTVTIAKTCARAFRADLVRSAAGLIPFAALGLTLAVAITAWSEQGFVHPLLTNIGGVLQRIETGHFDTAGIGLAILLSALSAGLFAAAQLDNFRRNAVRYRNALKRINDIAEHPHFGLARAHELAEHGDRTGATRLVAEMHAVMSAEFSEWVTLALPDKELDMERDTKRASLPGNSEPDRATPGAGRYRLVTDASGSTDLSAQTKLEPLDFDAIRAKVGARLLRARRIGYVAARRAEREEPVVTRWNGRESKDVARPGDWIATNMSAARELLRDREGSLNTYVIRAAMFPDLYDLDEGTTQHGAIYRSKSVVDAFLLPGSFDILAPWNEQQRGAQGYLICNSKGEVYGNNRETFEATYEIIDALPTDAHR